MIVLTQGVDLKLQNHTSVASVLPAYASYTDIGVNTSLYLGGATTAASSGTSLVTFVSGPTDATSTRHVKFFTVYNPNAAAVDLELFVGSSTLTRITLLGLSTLVYADAQGFSVIDSSGVNNSQSSGDEPIDVRLFGAKGDGTTDDTASIQAAITYAAGRPVKVPAGTYVITSTLTDVPTSLVGRNRGTRIQGSGPFTTIFDNRVANGPMINLDTGTNNEFQLHSSLSGFQIKTTTSPSASIGILLRRQWQARLQSIYINGLTADGIKISVQNGDSDSSIHIVLDNVWIYQCAGWGINCDCASGHNEMSYLSLISTRVESCGTTSGSADPPSGGMRWKGQVLALEHSAFVTNENIGLVIYSGAGAANDARAYGTTWENNKKRHLWIQTLSNGLFDTCQFYSNDSFLVTAGVDLTPTGGGSCNDVKFVNSIVRASSGNNPIVAFTLDANCQDCVIEDTKWDLFGSAGQTRFSNASFAVGTRIIDDGILCWGHAVTTNATRGTIVSNNAKGVRGLNGSGNNTFALIQITASDEVQVGSSSTRTRLDQAATHHQVIATASLPAAGAGENGRIVIEDAGAGDRNLIIYAGGERFRIDGGAAF